MYSHSTADISKQPITEYVMNRLMSNPDSQVSKEFNAALLRIEEEKQLIRKMQDQIALNILVERQAEDRQRLEKIAAEEEKRTKMIRQSVEDSQLKSPGLQKLPETNATQLQQLVDKLVAQLTQLSTIKALNSVLVSAWQLQRVNLATNVVKALQSAPIPLGNTGYQYTISRTAAKKLHKKLTSRATPQQIVERVPQLSEVYENHKQDIAIKERQKAPELSDEIIQSIAGQKAAAMLNSDGRTKFLDSVNIMGLRHEVMAELGSQGYKELFVDKNISLINLLQNTFIPLYSKQVQEAEPVTMKDQVNRIVQLAMEQKQLENSILKTVNQLPIQPQNRLIVEKILSLPVDNGKRDNRLVASPFKRVG